MSRTYAIADLHGRFDLLQVALDAIQQREPGTVVTLGDYVDRGPHSREIIQMLIQGLPAPWKLICLRGNHEDLMLDCIEGRMVDPDGWMINGGGYTLVSYGHARSGKLDFTVVPKAHVDWLKTLPLMHVDKHRVYVHAGIDPIAPLDKQKPEVLTWKLYNHNTDVGHKPTGRHVVHGHHQFENGPKLYKHRTDLDTFAWATGRLVIGVFDDEKPGGPIDTIEIIGEPHEWWAGQTRAEEANLVKAPG